MTGDDMGEFVADDGGELGIGAGDFEDAGVDADFAAGEGEGVGGVVFEEDELPVGVLDGDVAFEAAGDAVEGGGLGGVMGDAFAGLHALELGEAHFVEFGVGDEVERAAAGVGDGGAGVKDEGGGEAQGQVEAQGRAWHGGRGCDAMVRDLGRSSTVCRWGAGGDALLQVRLRGWLVRVNEVGWAELLGVGGLRPVLEILVTLPRGGAASLAASAACPLWIE